LLAAELIEFRTRLAPASAAGFTFFGGKGLSAVLGDTFDLGIWDKRARAHFDQPNLSLFKEPVQVASADI
jgi:hypothetical protein